MRTRNVFVALAIAGAAACAAPTPGPATGDDLTRINALRDNFVAAFNAGDAAKVVEGYTSDVIVMPTNHAMLSGKDAVLAYDRDFFSQMSTRLTLTPLETTIAGNWGYDRGTYSMTLTPKGGGASMTDKGKYLVILRKQADGSWKVSRDMNNSDEPMPEPPPPPPPPPTKGKGK